MGKKTVIAIAAAIAVYISAVPLYAALLDQLLIPYRMYIDDRLARIDERNKARREIALTIDPGEREKVLNEKFGKLPMQNELVIQREVMRGWQRFCVIAFGGFALGTLLDYLLRLKTAKKGHMVRHLFALPAFAFALPTFFFTEGALRIIKPAALLTAAIFAFVVILTSLSAARKSRHAS